VDIGRRLPPPALRVTQREGHAVAVGQRIEPSLDAHAVVAGRGLVLVDEEGPPRVDGASLVFGRAHRRDAGRASAARQAATSDAGEYVSGRSAARLFSPARILASVSRT
jgi:hypothetical protein